MATPDQTLLGWLQDVLLEPRNGGQLWPSDLWSRDEVLSAANLHQNRLLFDTLLLIGLADVPVTAGNHRYDLPDDWLRTFGVVWIGDDGTVRELLKSNSFEADHLISSWEQTDASYPLVYFEEETGTATIQIAPAPTGAGKLTVLYVPIGTELNGNGELLNLPDDLAHAIKYGALSVLLSKDGRGKDADRASYCDQRFTLAEEATKIILQGWA